MYDIVWTRLDKRVAQQYYKCTTIDIQVQPLTYAHMYIYILIFAWLNFRGICGLKGICKSLHP